MVVEASFWASKNGCDLVMAEDVEGVEHKEYRNLIEEDQGISKTALL